MVKYILFRQKIGLKNGIGVLFQIANTAGRTAPHGNQAPTGLHQDKNGHNGVSFTTMAPVSNEHVSTGGITSRLFYQIDENNWFG